MNSISRHLSPKALKKNCSSYSIVDPSKFYRKLNRVLRTPAIRREFHRTTRAYEAIRRWEVIEHFDFDRYPRLTHPLEGEQWLYPYQLNSLCWDWDLGPGRRPFFHQFVLPMSCHWTSAAQLMVARALFPQMDWCVVSSERHTSVICPSECLLFDLTYHALDVSALSALELIFGDDFDSDDYEVFEDEYPMSRNTVELMHLFDLLDERPEEDRLRLIRDFPEVMGRELIPA